MSADASLLPRSLAPTVQEALNDTPVVCLLGPRQSGKTTLARELVPDRAFVSLDEHNYYQTAMADPAGFIAGLPDEVTLDEVQRVPELLPPSSWPWIETAAPGAFSSPVRPISCCCRQSPSRWRGAWRSLSCSR